MEKKSSGWYERFQNSHDYADSKKLIEKLRKLNPKDPNFEKEQKKILDQLDKIFNNIRKIYWDDNKKMYLDKINENKLWYKRITKAGSKNDTPLVTASVVYCFKTPFQLKDVFTRITKRYISARNAKKRFYWDAKNKMWCTASKDSADEAEKELKQLVGDRTFQRQSTPVKSASFIPRNEPVIDINKRDWNSKDKMFSFELSDKNIGWPGKIVWLKSPSGQAVKFKLYQTDMDGSHEDTYGWNYKSEDGKFRLLIIND